MKGSFIPKPETLNYLKKFNMSWGDFTPWEVLKAFVNSIKSMISPQLVEGLVEVNTPEEMMAYILENGSPKEIEKAKNKLEKMHNKNKEFLVKTDERIKSIYENEKMSDEKKFEAIVKDAKKVLSFTGPDSRKFVDIQLANGQKIRIRSKNQDEFRRNRKSDIEVAISDAKGEFPDNAPIAYSVVNKASMKEMTAYIKAAGGFGKEPIAMFDKKIEEAFMLLTNKTGNTGDLDAQNVKDVLTAIENTIRLDGRDKEIFKFLDNKDEFGGKDSLPTITIPYVVEVEKEKKVPNSVGSKDGQIAKTDTTEKVLESRALNVQFRLDGKGKLQMDYYTNHPDKYKKEANKHFTKITNLNKFLENEFGPHQKVSFASRELLTQEAKNWEANGIVKALGEPNSTQVYSQVIKNQLVDFKFTRKIVEDDKANKDPLNFTILAECGNEQSEINVKDGHIDIGSGHFATIVAQLGYVEPFKGKVYNEKEVQKEIAKTIGNTVAVRTGFNEVTEFNVSRNAEGVITGFTDAQTRMAVSVSDVIANALRPAVSSFNLLKNNSHLEVKTLAFDATTRLGNFGRRSSEVFLSSMDRITRRIDNAKAMMEIRKIMIDREKVIKSMGGIENVSPDQIASLDETFNKRLAVVQSNHQSGLWTKTVTSGFDDNREIVQAQSVNDDKSINVFRAEVVHKPSIKEIIKDSIFEKTGASYREGINPMLLGDKAVSANSEIGAKNVNLEFGCSNFKDQPIIEYNNDDNERSQTRTRTRVQEQTRNARNMPSRNVGEDR